MYWKLNFPFFIIEEGNNFEFTDSIDSIINKLNNTKQIVDEDKVYFNLYIIDSEYKISRPEIDHMGSLNHYHVDNIFISDYKRRGLETLNMLFKIEV